MLSRTAAEELTADRERLVRGLIAAGAAVSVAFVAGRLVPQSDVQLYARYANRMLHESLTAGLPREYPALAGLVFMIVAFLPFAYLPAFMATMATALIALVVAGERLLSRPGWSQRLLLYLVLGTAPLMLARYDLLPGLCAFCSVAMAMRGRFAGSWVAAAAGAAFKIFPALLLPGLFIVEWRRTGVAPWRRVAMLAGVGILAVIAQSVFAPGTLWSPVRYEMARGFEFSSIPGTLTLLADPLHLSWHHDFGAWQIHGRARGTIGVAMALAEVCLLAAVWTWLYWRRISIAAASLAVLSVAMVTDRALAPQYLIWVAPLWALWPLRKSWVAASLLTVVTYPIAFFLEPAGTVSNSRDLMLATAIAAVRNVLLVVGTVAWLRSELEKGAEMPEDVGGALSRPS